MQKPCFHRAFRIDGESHRDSARQGEDYQTCLYLLICNIMIPMIVGVICLTKHLQTNFAEKRLD